MNKMHVIPIIKINIEEVSSITLILDGILILYNVNRIMKKKETYTQ